MLISAELLKLFFFFFLGRDVNYPITLERYLER